ncbi:MAG TPA: hypothetical protein VL173_13565 [Vicinamibacterales bacterium]|nr:hypothetical protein [Vicinamibacterales bacterium]
MVAPTSSVRRAADPPGTGVTDVVGFPVESEVVLFSIILLRGVCFFLTVATVRRPAAATRLLAAATRLPAAAARLPTRRLTDGRFVLIECLATELSVKA